MERIDLWSFFIGIVSIASFMLAMWDRFPALKKYLLPLGYILLGVTLSRVSFVGREATLTIIKDSQVAASLIIFLSLLLLSLFCFHLMAKKGNEMMGYVIIVIILSSIAPSLLSTFSKINEKIPPKDYLSLAVVCEKNNDYDSAVKYLNRYLDVVSDTEMKKQLESKIAQLKQRQLDGLR
ncbi:MAG: hypothetical protein Q8O13_08275 [Candidatus Omnitrophota bacterium]|nr:hypothetical protein [Candidatus Omnitrophota bacterium]